MITEKLFGATARGEAVTAYTLAAGAARAVFLDYGCVLQSLYVPDRTGEGRNIVLGYTTVADYERGSIYIGELVGRVANRIARSSFSLDGETVTLTPNEGENHLHGTWGSALYAARIEGDTLIFSRTSPDGEEGYPGEVSLTVSCTLSESGLRIEYRARAAAKTVLNLTHHTYFSLSDGTIDHQHLCIPAECYTPTDDALIPTGELVPVTGALDFRTERPIGDTSLDHNFVLNGALAATLYAPDTGLEVSVRTTQPGVQLYTGDGIAADRAVTRRRDRTGIAIEPQRFPDSVHHSIFPPVTVTPTEEYREEISYEWRVRHA